MTCFKRCLYKKITVRERRADRMNRIGIIRYSSSPDLKKSCRYRPAPSSLIQNGTLNANKVENRNANDKYMV